MKLVVNRDEMRRMDMRTIKDFGIPSRVLMETAGVRSADWIMENYPWEVSGQIFILCGKGNNGGDGYVIARHLFPYSQSVTILSLGEGRMSSETALNRKLCESLGIRIHDVNTAQDLDDIAALWDEPIDLLIDAVFGIGFHGDVAPNLREIFYLFDTLPAPRIAIDIPSGIDADTGNGYAIRMDATLAIAELKFGHLLGKGRELSGEIHTIPIGIPNDYRSGISAYHYEEIMLPARDPAGHKGDFGRVIAIGGSEGYLGSIKLAANAALRAGAGLTYLYSRHELLPYYYADPCEIMVFGIPQIAGNDPLPDEAALCAELAKADSIAIGCGMGLDDFAIELLRIVLTHSKVPTILDADALTILSSQPELIPLLKNGRFLLTPHKKEFCRLAKINMEELDQDPIGKLKEIQALLGCPILLKGHSSIYCDSSQIQILTAGNDALATGGSGDVLCGIIAALAATGQDIIHSACSASLLMGKTAERLSLSRESSTILPSDIINHIGDIDAQT
jgi:NAD(P)H-hydrate epimerase